MDDDARQQVALMLGQQAIEVTLLTLENQRLRGELAMAEMDRDQARVDCSQLEDRISELEDETPPGAYDNLAVAFTPPDQEE